MNGGLRILTWNTWWCFGPWEERQPLLRAAVAAQGADVVLLQETWPEQAEAVAEAAGLEAVALAVGPFNPNGVDPGPAGGRFGNAVLARPGTARLAGSLSLSSREDGAPRSGAAVWVDGTGSPLLVVATHLNHIAPAHEVRARQLGALTGWVDELSPTGPVVLGGDLNLTPYSPEYAAALQPHWADLWLEAHPEDPGATMVPANPRFRDVDWMDERNGPGAPPGVRFDYLLARRGPTGARTVRVKALEVIGDDRHGWPSDHLGLVADVAPAAPAG